MPELPHAVVKMLSGVAVNRLSGVGPVPDRRQKPVIVADLLVGRDVAVGSILFPCFQRVEERSRGSALVLAESAVNVVESSPYDRAAFGHTTDFSES